MTEQFANFATTTLNGGIDNAVTSIVVTSATPFPSSAQYRITIDTEIMIVTAGAGTTTWTVTRGAESTSAAAHSNGAAVSHTLTSGSLATFASLTSPALAGIPTAPTAAIGTSTTQAATTAFVAANINVGMVAQIGPSTYATIDPRNTAVVGAMATLKDSRFTRVTMAKTGTLHDISVLVATQSGNYKIGVYDTGNANGTHTTSTQLAVSNSAAVPAVNAWATYDPALSVNAGDTLNFHLSIDNTTAAVIITAGLLSAPAAQLPASFYPPSGAGTMAPKLCGLVSSFFDTPPSTITEANHTTAGKSVMFVWRIT